MRVLLVGNYAADAQYSMRFFARHLRQSLEARGVAVDWVEPPVVLGRLWVPKALRKWVGYLDKYLLFPPMLRWRARRAQLVHVCDQGNAMYAGWCGSRPVTVTCHDMFAIRVARGEIRQGHASALGRLQQRWIVHGLAKASRVLCASEATRQDLLKVLSAMAGRSQTVHMTLTRPLSPMSEADAARLLRMIGIAPEMDYLLHVGNNSWYKNRPGVLRIFAALPRRTGSGLRLVLAGKELDQPLRQMIEELGLRDYVLVCAAVSDEQLRALYSRAKALLYPSLAEGFGYPVLEAQSCGCPVITSNRAPMTEVGGEAALYVDPEDEKGAAELIALHFAELPELGRRGMKQAENFSGERLSAAYAEAFEACVRQAARGGEVTA